MSLTPIKLFGQNVEIKILVNDKMKEDFKQCDATGCAPVFGGCRMCSWNDVRIMGRQACCTQEVRERVRRLLEE